MTHWEYVLVDDLCEDCPDREACADFKSRRTARPPGTLCWQDTPPTPTAVTAAEVEAVFKRHWPVSASTCSCDTWHTSTGALRWHVAEKVAARDARVAAEASTHRRGHPMTPDLHELARLMADTQGDYETDEFLDEANAVLESDWLRDRDARVAAQALRDAADEVYGDGRARGPHWHPLSIVSWLRARAVAIERGTP